MPETISKSTPQFHKHPIEAALELQPGGRPSVFILYDLGDLVPALVLPEHVGHFHAQLLDVVAEGEDVGFLAHRSMAGNHGVEIELHGSVEGRGPFFQAAATAVID